MSKGIAGAGEMPKVPQRFVHFSQARRYSDFVDSALPAPMSFCPRLANLLTLLACWTHVGILKKEKKMDRVVCWKEGSGP